MKVQSNSIVFMDTTDTTKIDVHIGVNHPTVQIYDINKGTYTPNWSENVLELKPTVYADGLNVTDFLSDFKWVEIQGSETEEHFLKSKTTSDDKNLYISDNLSQTIGTVRYKFYAWYNNKEFSNEISFALTVTGRDGADGYTPQKGIDYFDGIDGKDGTSVTIEGVAYSDVAPTTGQSIDLYSDPTIHNNQTRISSTTNGESYLVDGYLCVYNIQIGKFICTGKIQGPKGEQGDSSYLYVRYAEDQYGTGMVSSPSEKTPYIGFYRTSVKEEPANASFIKEWIRFIGESASLVSITPTALYFKSTEGRDGVFTPDNIYLYPRFQGVSYKEWQYSADGGMTWNKVSTGANGLTINTYNSVPNALKINKESDIYTDTITSVSFRCLSSNDAIYDTVSVAKIYDVVDLKIGGRNLARYTDSEKWVSYDTANVSFLEGTRSKRIKAVCNVTDNSISAHFGIQQATEARLMILQPEKEYTLSFLVRGNVDNLDFVNLINPGSTYQLIEGIDISGLSETNFIKVSKTFTMSAYIGVSVGSYLAICYEGPKDPSMWFEIEEVQLEAGQVATDWAPSPEDILDSAANVNVMLSNEAHFFEADSKGVPTATSLVLDVVGFKGSIQSPTKIGTITGLPSAGMTATVSNDNTTNTKITIAVTTALTSAIADYGTLTIPITVNGHTINKMFSWSKAKAGVIGATGVGVKSTTVWYSVSNSASTMPADNTWKSTIPVVDEGQYLWTRTVTDYTDDTIPETVTYTYSKQGVKGDTGSSGSSVTVTSIQYKEGTSATTAPTGTWSDSVVSVAEGKYLWTKTAFSDGKIAYGVAKQGVSGKDGVGINSTTVDYGISDSASVQPTTWQQAIPTVAEGKYLWTRTVTDYTDTAKADTVTYVYAKQGSKGETGTAGTSVTVKSIQYQGGTSATVAPTDTWSNSVVSVAEGNYLWTKTTFSDNKVAYGVAKQGQKGDQGIQGIQGPKGNDAYTVMLTNESHIFAGDVSNAIAGSTTTQVLAYNGSTAQTVTIVSVSGKTAATTDTDTGIAGLKFKCSALSGVSPTITFTCTTSFVSKSGSIPIVLSVGGVQFTKMFTYSIAFKGSTGAQGSTGTPASLVNITPSAHYFKSTTGKDGTFTPDYIYLYPRFQTVTYSKWEYSINGGTTWAAASGANGLTIGTYNSIVNTLRIAKTSTLYTDTITSISFRCVSSNASVYDTVSIAKIYDVVDLRFEGRNLVLNSNQSVSSDTYRTFVYDMSEDWVGGETYTISIKGSLNEGQAFGVWANGSATRVTTLTYDASKDIYTSTFVASTSIVTQLPKTLHVYNTPSDTATESAIEWIKLEKGSRLTNWLPAPEDLKSTTFQLYAPKGYLITNDVPEVMLQTFAYDGSQAITDATFVWYSWNGEVWVAISGATGTSLTLNKSSVLKSNVYKCVMTYKGKTYEATATVEDKTDVYESIMCISSNARGNDCYWVLYTLVYTDAEEVDPLLGPISINAPTSPVSGDYWYAVDETNASVQLKKYNGTAWASSTDTQSLSYYWDIVNNGSEKVPFGDHSKVQVVSCNDFTATATLVCGVNNVEDGLLTQSSLSLTDASDPIVSTTEPVSVVDGQIWIKPNNNGTYIMSIWDNTNGIWVVSDMDTRTKVYTSKPSDYNVGDLWITASDTEHSGYLEGTLLMASTSSSTFSESHWSTTLKYDKDLDSINKTLNDLSQYVNITSEGLRIGAQSVSGEISPFTSLFTSTELAFYQNSDKLLTLSNNQLIAPHIVIEDDLEVGKTISLGNLNLTIETNGSFSFTVTK